MSIYRKIDMSIWTDEKFCGLSPLNPCGKSLWIYLLTGPHTGPVPGLSKAGRVEMADGLGWSLTAFDKAFLEISSKGMAEADFDAGLIWLHNAIKYNRPGSPHMVRLWRKHFRSLPDCDLKSKAAGVLQEELGAMSPKFLPAFAEATGKACRATDGGVA